MIDFRRTSCLILLFAARVELSPHRHLDSDSQGAANSLTEEDVIPASESLNDGLFIEVLSSPRSCLVKANGRTVLYREKLDGAPPRPPRTFFDKHMSLDGTYLVTVHPDTGRATGHVFADGHSSDGAFYGMHEYLQHVQPGRVAIFCTLAESALSMNDNGESLFTALNSSYAPDIQLRSVFALVAVKGGAVIAEGYNLNLDSLDLSHPGYTLRLTTTVPRGQEPACEKLRTPENAERFAFCQKHDGYRRLCDCDNPIPIHYPPKPFDGGRFFEFPVIVMASNRPQYLFRCLSSLLPVRGLHLDRLVVFLDGDFPEVMELLQLLGVRVHQHYLDLVGLSSGHVATRIGYNYRYTIEKAFEMFPDADKIILLEEDLEVSPDFLSYFDQTHWLLDKDVSLYCVSAWNDHGYRHTVGDPAQLYRVGFLPGLGWMLKRSLFFDEILPVWPATWKTFDWDVFLRLGSNRRGRDCIIPDVPRTYHFGYVGNHVKAGMQFAYFYDHALNTEPDVRLRDVGDMVYPKYEKQLQKLIKSGIPLDEQTGNSTSCKTLVPSDTKNQTYLLFLRMYGPDDTESFAKIATCLNLWDLDPRGDHHGIWRFWYNGNHIVVIGVPYSPLSAFAIGAHDDAAVFSGARTAAQRQLGRWPPGMPRARLQGHRRRMRLAMAALHLRPDQLREVTAGGPSR